MRLLWKTALAVVLVLLIGFITQPLWRYEVWVDGGGMHQYPLMCLPHLPLPSRRKHDAAGLPDQTGVLEALPDDANDARQESAGIGILAFIEPERLLVEVSEQVKGFNANVGALDGSLEQAPE